MASIRREFVVAARPEDVWAAVRDVGAIHERLVPGFVVDCRLEGDARRHAWSAAGGWLTHHNASLQVFAEGADRSRVVWIADLLPNEMAGPIAAMIDQGVSAMKRTLERGAR
jgi:carbon monoxide dehydrogenase subunit G